MKIHISGSGMVLLLIVSVLNLHVPAGADDSVTREYYLKEVVVTATRTEQVIDAVAADVEILHEKDIESSAAVNVDDMVKRFSGIDISQPSDMAVTSPVSISIRGVTGPNRVLFMVDGIPINSALTGFILPFTVQPSSIERVEVAKGSFSSLYGSNAMAGVINVITKKRRTPGWEQTPFITAGSHGLRETGMRFAGRQDKLSCSVDVGYRTINNHYRNDERVKYSYNRRSGSFTRQKTDTTNTGFREARFAGRMDYDISPASGLTLSGSYSKSSTGMGETTRLKAARERDIDRTAYYLAAGGHAQVHSSLMLEVRLFTNYDTTDSIDEILAARPRLLLPGTRSRYEYGKLQYWGRNTGLQVQASQPWGRRHFLTIGSELNYLQGYWKNRGEAGKVAGTVMDKTMSTQALYFQNETALLEKLTITLGGRLDVNSRSKNSFSPKIGLLYRLNERLSLRASAGRAFRAPSLAELYMPTWQMIPGIFFMSNPDLRPEVIWSYDCGVSAALPGNTTLKVTGFYTDAKDLISNVITRGVMRYENLSKVKTIGFEVGLVTAPYKWLRAYVNYTCTRAKDKKLGRLGDVPQHRVNAGVRTLWRVSPRAVVIPSLDMRFSDTLFYMDRMTKKRLKLDAFTVLDATLQISLDERISLKAVMTNLTNTGYEQHGGNAGPERAYWFKMEYRFNSRKRT